MNDRAIYNLYPNVVSIDGTAGPMDADGKPVSIDDVAVEAEAARLAAIPDVDPDADIQSDIVTEVDPLIAAITCNCEVPS